MSHASLAARYRPQTFAEVTGQETVKAILSRAAAEDKIAPAYLLSGTRGVGKTTIARIFAKALNCAHAPTAEPCNQCEACRSITQGSFVDVVEIDGASNNGIEEARRLRENIGYAPMEGRYKVFIIDEAHMLSKAAFNALLKTLEEPPPHATFIMATTEPQKFPVTIVSRCQHFVFKALPENALVAHLERILTLEKIGYDENAVRLIARRAAGSVRDSMSLLGQTLALGGELLSEASARAVLGLAGQELYERVIDAIARQDCVAVSALTRELLEAGADLGFFLRELALLWRNLFLLRQAGEAALGLIDMPECEKKRLLALAGSFELSVIHAAWQMTLEGQRQVLTSLEPSAALELLLLNLALLPRLASMELFSRSCRAKNAGTSGPLSTPGCQPHAASARPEQEAGRPPLHAESPGTAAKTQAPHEPPAGNAPQTAFAAQKDGTGPSAYPQAGNATPSEREKRTNQQGNTAAPAPKSASAQSINAADDASSRAQKPPQTRSASAANFTPNSQPVPRPAESPKGLSRPVVSSAPAAREHNTSQKEDDGETQSDAAHPSWPCDWQTFIDYCAGHLSGDSPLKMPLIRQLKGECAADTLTVEAESRALYEMVSAPERKEILHQLACQCADREIELVLHEPALAPVMEGDLKSRMEEHEAVVLLKETFNASLLRCTPRTEAGASSN